MTPALAIASALSARPVHTSRGWLVPCPAHDDRDPSLHVSDGADGKLLLRCFAGCDQVAIIAALRERGLWGRISPRGERPHYSRPMTPTPADPRMGESAMRLWRHCRPAAGTLVEAYLLTRAITVTPPASIRFHPSLLHRLSGQRFPAMVVAVRNVGERIVAVHRTWLRCDGLGKAAVEPAKMALGPCRGGAVRLAPATDVLQVAEGIETALAAMQATDQPTWASLGTSGLKSLALPAGIRHVTILADGDAPGEAAARAAGERWVREGREVRIARAPAGLDFADVLAGECAASVAGVAA